MTADLLGTPRAGVSHAVEQMVWQGAAGDAARASGEDLVKAMRGLRRSVELQAETLSRARGPLTLAQAMLAQADRLAASHGLAVLADGSVTRPPPDMYATDAAAAVVRQIAQAQAAAGRRAGPGAGAGPGGVGQRVGV